MLCWLMQENIVTIAGYELKMRYATLQLPDTGLLYMGAYWRLMHFPCMPERPMAVKTLS